MPSTSAKCRQCRSRGWPAPGITRTCTRSAGRSGVQRSRTPARSQVRMLNSGPPAALPAMTASRSTVLPFFTDSCHPAETTLAASRAVTTRCTSASGKSAIARDACSALAPQRNSWVISTSPVCADASSTSRRHAPGASAWRRASLGRSCRSRAAQRCSRWPNPGRNTPADRRRSRLAHTTCWRYVVPVLGSPTCRKTRRGPPRSPEPGLKRSPRGTSRAAPPASPRRARPRAAAARSRRR